MKTRCNSQRPVYRQISSIALLLLTLPSTSPVLAQTPDTGVAQNPPERSRLYRVNTMLAEYLDLVKQGNIESAAQYWLPASTERAQRLGIKYSDIAFKTDLNSPLLKSAKLKPVIKQRGAHTVDSTFAIMEISATVKGQPLKYLYYAAEVGGYPWLIFPQDMYCRDWETVRTRYFHLRYNPERKADINQIALDALDAFVDSTAQRLGISSERIAFLAEAGIDYFLCADEAEVGKISGAEARGRLDQASDALFSSALPHYHEVSHLLVNYHLQELPLTTLPFLKEGLATYLGGRAGRAPAGMLDMAAYLFKLEVVTIDSLLELMSFHVSSDASIAYSSAALFVKALDESYGMETLLNLYRSLSGDFTFTSTLSVDQIREVIETETGAAWEDILQRFDREYVSGKFRLADDYPRLRPGAPVGDAQDGGAMLDNVRVIRIQNRLYIVADISESPKGTLFFGLSENRDFRSELFVEQFGEEHKYSGHRFAIRYDANEAGLYDYATSTLIAKHIESFAQATDPEAESEYLLDDGSKVAFSFPLELTGGKIPGSDAILLTE